MRVFSAFLFILTVLAGLVSHNATGTLTETLKLAYACLALSTVACTLITLTMPQVANHDVREQTGNISAALQSE